jgi:C-terminal peptidase prc
LWLLAMTNLAPARADVGQVGGPYVVLIGVSDYADPRIPRRLHAEADAAALYDLLTNKDYLGADRSQTRLLLGKPDAGRGSQAATRANILKALHWVAAEARPDDLVIVAFFGQVATVGAAERVCYLAADSTLAGRANDAVTAAEVALELDNLKSQRFAAFLDVSFQAVGGRDIFSEANIEGGAYREFLGSDGKEEGNAPAPGRMVFLSSPGRATPPDLGDHGLFATVLLDALKGRADREGYEPDGAVTVGEVMTYFVERFPPLAQRHGSTRDEKELYPLTLGLRTTRFELTRNPAAAPRVRRRLDVLQKLVADSTLSEPLGAEGVRLLGRMPRLEWQRSLRKEYQHLADGSLSAEAFARNRDTILAARKMERRDALSYAGKVAEAAKIIHDSYVKEVNVGELVAGAVRGLYRRAEEDLPPSLAGRLAGARDLKEADLTQLLADARLQLGKREDLDNHKDIDVSLQQMTSHLDPYTTYVDPATVTQFSTNTVGSFTGIGVSIRRDPVRDMLRVVSPLRGSPAHKAGVLEGDLLAKITREVDGAGKPLDKPEAVPGKGLSVDEAVRRLMGRPGTKVKVTVERDGKEIEFEIARASVELETVLGVRRNTNAEWDYWADPAGRIAYVRLTSFTLSTYRDLHRLMQELGARRGEVRGLVLDLRFDLGGLLTSAWSIADLFIDDGAIMTIRPRVGRENTITGKSEGSLLGFPMVCLINGNSASASEIVAACLQDHHRAIIVGERSFGKGSMQNVQPFEGGQLKVTTALWAGPGGKNLNRASTAGKEDDEWGVTPDRNFTIKLSRKEREELLERLRDAEIIHRPDRKPDLTSGWTDRQLARAVEYLRGRDDAALRSRALALNEETGEGRIEARARALAEDAEATRKLLVVAAGMAREGEQPFNINAAFILAGAAQRLKQTEGGELFYRLALEQTRKLQSDSKRGQAGLALLQLYEDFKTHAETEKLCAELLGAADGKTPTGWRLKLVEGLARALARQGKTEEASRALEQYFSDPLARWQLLKLRADLRREAGEDEQAAATYEAALAAVLASEGVNEGQKIQQAENIRYILSKVYGDLNRVDRAAEHLKALLARRPDAAAYNNDLGYIWADHDMNLAEAEQLIRKAIDEDRKQALARAPTLKPEEVRVNSGYFDSLGWVLYRQKNYQEAKRYLLQAAQGREAGGIEIYDHLGDVCLALGERAEAAAAWRKAVEVAGPGRREQKRKAAVEKKLGR